MSADENNLIWIDLEMTGLDPERDRIIENCDPGDGRQPECPGGRAYDCGASV